MMGTASTRQFDIEFEAIEHERRRVAKELHDEILPAMARLTRWVLNEDSEGLQNDLIEEMHKTIAAFRDFLGELHPVDLEIFGLLSALSNICSRYARLTGLCVFLLEKVEEIDLPELEQLCLYRAMQAALRMFADSGNDILLITCSRNEHDYQISVRCIDKRVHSADWLSAEKRDFNAFESWCLKAGATVAIGTARSKEFPLDLIISVPCAPPDCGADVSHRIGCDLVCSESQDIHDIHSRSQTEIKTVLQQEESLVKTLAEEAERKRIIEEMERLIMPRFETLRAKSGSFSDDILRAEFLKRLNTIANSVSEVMAEMHPALLGKTSLVGSIRTLVELFSRSSQIETTLISNLYSEQTELSLEAKFAIYRVTQEALNNIEKHSGASTARIILKCTENELTVFIEDNGKGFKERRSIQSRGLKNIRERAASVGAKVAWEKSINFDSGTLLSICLQCRKNQAAQTDTNTALRVSPR
jgi:signal transduction histidine kinase